MSAARRTTSTRVTRLTAKASPYHAAVTLYEADEANAETQRAGPSAPRRRTKRAPEDSSTSAAAHPTRERDPSPLADTTAASPSKKPRSRTSKTKPIPQALEVPHPAPARWADAYDAIKVMRAQTVAPVDTMGCEQAQFREQLPKNQRFATLVSLMLSSQTKDEVTDAALTKLRTALGGSLSLQAVLDAEEATISDAIAKVGFWRRKTQYIKQTARRLQDDFEGDVPKTVDELCSLPGVGPKMAFLVLQVAWKLNVGIGVDVHVHRITNRLGWHVRPTKNPEETRLNLQSWLPKALHGEINHLLVGFGQTICLPVGPKCGECTLSADGLCPSARSVKTKTKHKTSSVQKRSSRREEDTPEGSGPRIEIAIEEEPATAVGE